MLQTFYLYLREDVRIPIFIRYRLHLMRERDINIDLKHSVKAR